MDPVSRTARNDRSPAPLIAAAAALAGAAAARSPLGKLALLAAAGTAAYRWLNRRPSAPSGTEPDWCQIRTADGYQDADWEDEATESAIVGQMETSPEEAPIPLMAQVFAPTMPTLMTEPIAERPAKLSLAPNLTEETPQTRVEEPVEPVEKEAVSFNAVVESTPEPELHSAPDAEAKTTALVEAIQSSPVNLLETAPVEMPVPVEERPSSVPLLQADPLPHITESTPLATAIHALDSDAENKWLLAVEPLPVLLEKEPRQIHEGLVNSGLLGSSLDPVPEAFSVPPSTSSAPTIALGGDIPDSIDIDLPPPTAATEITPQAKMEKPASGPLTSDRLAELLKALAGTSLPEPAPFVALVSPLPEPVAPAAFEPVAPVLEPAVTPQAVIAKLSLPALPPVATVEPASASKPPTPEPASIPLVSAAALFANLAQKNPSGPLPSVDVNPPEAVDLLPPQTANTIRPKLRPRPIVTIAHPNNPARKNWLTWWK